MKRIEEAARTLQWNDERPWRVQSHTWTDKGVPFVDLHDLSIRLALDAVDIGVELKLPCIGFITGRGRHTIDGHSRLREAVHGHLNELAIENAWSWRVLSPGRCVLVLDPSRSPTYATGALPWWAKLIIAEFIVLAAVALGASVIP